MQRGRMLTAGGLAAALLLFADSDGIRAEIQATYDRALEAQRKAKTIEDLDAVSRQTDTPDWISITDDGLPLRWRDLREQTARSLGGFPEMAIRILKFDLKGDTAVVIARVGPPGAVAAGDATRTVLIRDTWIRTPAGWRRKMHEKPAPGRLEAEIGPRRQ